MTELMESTKTRKIIIKSLMESHDIDQITSKIDRYFKGDETALTSEEIGIIKVKINNEKYDISPTRFIVKEGVR